MLAVRYFFWFVLLAFGTMVVLLFAAPALPVHPLREVAEGQRTTIAGAAAATLVVAFVALFLIKGLWTNELKALAPSRFGLLTLLISSFVAVSGWTVVVMLQWNALDILPRPQDQSVAVAVLSVWLGLVGAATTWVCWITFRERALRPVFSAALESGKLGAVLGAVETAPGAQRLVDPVTFHPSVAWVLDVETTDYWTTTTPLSKGEQTAGQGPVKRESLPRHKRHPLRGQHGHHLLRAVTNCQGAHPGSSCACDSQQKSHLGGGATTIAAASFPGHRGTAAPRFCQFNAWCQAGEIRQQIHSAW